MNQHKAQLLLARPTLTADEQLELLTQPVRIYHEQLADHASFDPTALLPHLPAAPIDATYALLEVWANPPQGLFDCLFNKAASNGSAWGLWRAATCRGPIPPDALETLLGTRKDARLACYLAGRTDLPQDVALRFARDRRKSVRNAIFANNADYDVIQACLERSRALNDSVTPGILLAANPHWSSRPPLYQSRGTGPTLPPAVPRDPRFELLAAAIAADAVETAYALDTVHNFLPRSSPVGVHTFLDACTPQADPDAIALVATYALADQAIIDKLLAWPDPRVRTAAAQHALAPRDALQHVAQKNAELLDVTLSRAALEALLPQVEGDDHDRLRAVLGGQQAVTVSQPAVALHALLDDDGPTL